MNNNSKTYFPSKILLFGEYSVTIGSDALAVPFNKFNGSWQFDKQYDNKNLYKLAQYLKDSDWEKYKTKFYFDQFISDLDLGLFFQSNIKTGYGAGSSGALCAGIFEIFFKPVETDLENLNAILAKIEGYFHGVSSGIDPLVSYTNQMIRTHNHKFELFENDILNFNKYSFYLLDSTISRSTKKYVDIFNEKRNNVIFITNYLNPLIKFNNRVISSFLSRDEDEVFDLFNKISKIQFEAFKEMIIDDLYTSWDKALSNNDLSIKLCGAGGGGYYLIMAKKDTKTIRLFNQFDILQID